MRREFTPAAAFLNADGLQNLDVFARLGELANADAVNGVNEFRRTAVHDRHFFAVDLDVEIVDGKAAKRGEKMFDGSDRRAGIVTDDGTEC